MASTTHRQLDDRALAAAGIDPGAVRFSIGLEDSEDLISDAFVALERPRAADRTRRSDVIGDCQVRGYHFRVGW